MSLLYLKNIGKAVDVIGQTERIFGNGLAQPEDEFRRTLRDEFRVEQLLKGRRNLVAGFQVFLPGFQSLASEPFAKDWITGIVSRKLEALVRAPKYVAEEVAHYYFGKAREYETAGILRRAPDEISTLDGTPRLEVIDLPSLRDRNSRLLVGNALVAEKWNRARAEWFKALGRPYATDRRVPLFIVIDEAHNLIPSEPRGRAEMVLREQFRTIIAEGRKYGLFLILATQRPEKLDPFVLSECENKAIMRMGSLSVLNATRSLLGLEDVSPRLLEKCLEFGSGRVLLLAGGRLNRNSCIVPPGELWKGAGTFAKATGPRKRGRCSTRLQGELPQDELLRVPAGTSDRRNHAAPSDTPW